MAYKYKDVKEYIDNTGCKLLSSEYLGCFKDLEILCSCGKNIFYRSFTLFKNGKSQKCLECNNKTYWDYEKVKIYVESLGYVLINKEYKNNREKLILMDKEGYHYFIELNSLLSHKIPNRFHIANPYTIKNIKLWCKINQKNFELISETYEGCKKDLQWKCLVDDCQEYFKANWNSIIIDTNCPFCEGTQVGLSNCLATKSPSLTSEWHPTLNGDLTPFDVTCGSHIDVWWLCNKNLKHKWHTIISNRYSLESGCPYCSGRLPSEDYNLLVYSPEVASEWNYDKNDKKPEEYCPNSGQYAWWKCKECEHEWQALISSRTNGSKCSKCNESRGENIISNILNINNIIAFFHHRFSDCKYKKVLEFDSYLPSYNTCIEYQGQQHYYPVDFAGKGKEWAEEQFKINQIKDQIKRDYCKNNNIKLVEIPYWDFDNIEEILKKELNIKFREVI